MSSIKSFIIREGKKSDCKPLAKLMKESAQEQLLIFTLDFQDLEKSGFQESPLFHIYVSQTEEGTIIGYLFYYYSYSTMVGRSVFAEDIFVTSIYRRRGVASALWQKFTQTALSKGCRRCDIYTISPSSFIRSREAVEQTDCFVFHLGKKAMENFVQKCKPVDGIEIMTAERRHCASIEKSMMALYEHLKIDASCIEINSSDLENDGFVGKPWYQSYVVEINNVLVGYSLFFFTYHFDGLGVHMEDIYVSPDHRGRGIGAALWNQVIKTGLEIGARRYYFNVKKDNTGSIKFYKNKGAIDITTSENCIMYKVDKGSLEKFA